MRYVVLLHEVRLVLKKYLNIYIKREIRLWYCD